MGACGTCCGPTASISYSSATGTVTYSGYVDPRYMIDGHETGYRSGSPTIPPYHSGVTYSTIHRTYFSGKFYQSELINNFGNQPDTSPSWWSECEPPVHWLDQTLTGDFTWFQFTFCNSPANCTSSLPPAVVFANVPGPGQFCQRRDFVFSGNAVVDHTTGVETWSGVCTQYNVTAVPNGTVCNQGSLFVTHTNEVDVLNDYLNSISQGSMFRSASDFSSTTFDTTIPSCVGGLSFGNNCSVYLISVPAVREFSSPESAYAYLTPNGVLTTTLSGTWSGAWTQSGLRAVLATFSITGGAASTPYHLTVNYTPSGGVTPPSEIYTFTTDGSGNATVAVNLPFGSPSQTVAIGSYAIA